MSSFKVAVVLLLAVTPALSALDLQVAPTDPARVIEYSESEGAIVHIKSFRRSKPNHSPDLLTALWLTLT